MRKKWIPVVLIPLVLLAGTYAWLRFSVLRAPGYRAENHKRAGQLPVDLRPQLIAKLQQLVHEGSDGLYRFAAEQVTPDIAAATLDARMVSITVDSQGYRRLEAARQLPDDVFQLHFRSLHITGIGIRSLLFERAIRAKSITLAGPVMAVWHRQQPYNQQQREQQARLSLYQRLTRQVDKISIDRVLLAHGTFTDHDVDHRKGTEFRDVSIQLDGILVDSATQYAKDRFLFARHALLESRGYSIRTADSLYELRIDALSVAGEQHQVTATGLSFRPRGSRRWFEQRVGTRQELFTLDLPRVTFSGVNWWAMLHRERFVAGAGRVDDGRIDIYLNRALPKSGTPIRVDNFPQQLLAGLPLPVSFRRFEVHNLQLNYEEYNPETSQAGRIRFEQLSGSAADVTNIPGERKVAGSATFAARCLFMGTVPLSGRFRFYLSGAAQGRFAADLTMGRMDHAVVNDFAPALGQVRLTSGALQQARVAVSGNNYRMQGQLEATYRDLHITPLKTRTDDQGALKRKPFQSLLANVLVKNGNPGKDGRLRHAVFAADREDHGNFFNFLWSAIKMGLLQLIGLPAAAGA